MSFALDVNLLLYASDVSSPHHQRASEFLRRCVSLEEVFCVAWPTVMAYLRISTHPAIFDRPLSPEEAAANVENLLQLPHVRVLSEEDDFWVQYRRTAEDVPARGNQVPDAHLAAILRLHGVRTLWTHDKDFRKYGFLEVRDPL